MRPWIGAAVVMLDLVGLEHTDGGGEVGVDVLDVAGEAVGDGDKVAGSVTLLNRRTPGVRPPFPLVGAESRWGKRRRAGRGAISRSICRSVRTQRVSDWLSNDSRIGEERCSMRCRLRLG